MKNYGVPHGGTDFMRGCDWRVQQKAPSGRELAARKGRLREHAGG